MARREALATADTPSSLTLLLRVGLVAMPYLPLHANPYVSSHGGRVTTRYLTKP